MTTFDKRKNEAETRFKHDEEIKFKATARRNKLFGLCAPRCRPSGSVCSATPARPTLRVRRSSATAPRTRQGHPGPRPDHTTRTHSISCLAPRTPSLSDTHRYPGVGSGTALARARHGVPVRLAPPFDPLCAEANTLRGRGQEKTPEP